IPEPDLTLILHVEAEIAQNLLKKRQRSDWTDKKQDIHEDKIEHLRKAEQIYLEIARSFSNINLIKCTRDKKILNPDKINTLIWGKVKEEIDDMPHLYHSTPEKDKNLLFKIKKLSDKAHYTEIENQAHYGVNLHSNGYHSINPKEKIIIDTDIEVNIPKGIFATILKNPSNNIHVLNEKLEPNTHKKIQVGIINLGDEIHHISPGDILAEMIIQKSEIIEFIEEEQEDKPNFRFFTF
ncbi:MAG TPA: hypothetical protein VJ895_02375, partial [Candidatus Nanoarchaeia archaeon]|nr:hypothetical protein [Candidatus Nanoarchaeia archaeon]